MTSLFNFRILAIIFQEQKKAEHFILLRLCVLPQISDLPLPAKVWPFPEEQLSRSSEKPLHLGDSARRCRR